MRRRKTKGSSMLLTIAIFGILSIVGTSMLAATTASYKMRITENNRVQNLYLAESGLDIAYVKLVEQINIAMANGVNASKEASKDKLISYKQAYVDYIVGDLKNNIKFGDGDGVTQPVGGSGNSTLSCNVYNKDGKTATNSIEDKIVQIDSSYVDGKGKERIVSINYEVKIPENVGGNVEDASSIINYSIATDKNFKVSGDMKKDINLLGNIWVQGKNINDNKNSSNPIKVGEDVKYNDGVIINNTNIVFNGDINTASNLSVDSGEVTLKNDNTNIFSENIYLHNTNGADKSNGNKLDVSKGNVYLANDLVLSSNDAKVSIKNFYGFNDINTEDKEFAYDNKTLRGSSSIIVNSMTWPKNDSGYKSGYLNISDKAYIMGTAYIKTATPYQTGESIAVKGNYEGYTSPIDGDDKLTEYKYYEPLLLVDRYDGAELTARDKAEHIAKYDDLDDVNLRTEGIVLPANKANIFINGAYINENEVKYDAIDPGKQSIDIINQRNNFVNAVYYMGSSKFGNNNLEDDFNKRYPITDVKSEINWSAVKEGIKIQGSKIKIYNNIMDKGLSIILNDDVNSLITVENANSGNGNDNLKIYLDGKQTVLRDEEVIIVTKGDVKCNNIKNFKGTIIALGDVTMNNCMGSIGTNTKLIDLINKKLDILGPIFSVEESIVESQVTAQELISKGKWKLVK